MIVQIAVHIELKKWHKLKVNMYYTEQMYLPCSPTKGEIQWLDKGSPAHRVLVEHVQGDNFKQQLTLGKHFHINLCIGKNILCCFPSVLIITTIIIFLLNKYI